MAKFNVGDRVVIDHRYRDVYVRGTVLARDKRIYTVQVEGAHAVPIPEEVARQIVLKGYPQKLYITSTGHKMVADMGDALPEQLERSIRAMCRGWLLSHARRLLCGQTVALDAMMVQSDDKDFSVTLHI